MLVITTAISGAGRNEYLEKMQEYAAARGKSVKIYHVGDLLFEQAKKAGLHLTHENVLNTPASVIHSLRSAVFEAIVRELPRDSEAYDFIFVNIHGIFYWKGLFQRAWDNYYVSQLHADAFVTIIDDGEKILERLSARKQWERQRLSLNEILMWQNVEIEITAGWADMYKKSFFILPAQSSPNILFRLVSEPSTELVYFAMPLSHLDSEDHTLLDDCIEKLEEHFIVFDPRRLKQIPSEEKRNLDDVRRNHMVFGDFYLIKQVHRVIAYFPKPVLSVGTINELREAHEANKETWLIYPNKEIMSPFLSYYCTKIFGSPQELFDFLKINS